MSEETTVAVEETTTAAPAAEVKETVEIPAEYKALVEQVEKMTVLELHL